LPFGPEYGTLSLQKLLKHEQFVNRQWNHTLNTCAAVLNEQARCPLKNRSEDRTAEWFIHGEVQTTTSNSGGRARRRQFGSMSPLCGSAKLLAPRQNAFDGSDF
jgi:hypothetical protein